jgi:hypothetical protein
MARPVKASPQIQTITAVRSATALDIVVQTTAVPSTYQIAENIYIYDSQGTRLHECGGTIQLHSIAGTKSSDTSANPVVIGAGDNTVQVIAQLVGKQGKRSVDVGEPVDSHQVAIEPLPAGMDVIVMTIYQAPIGR